MPTPQRLRRQACDASAAAALLRAVSLALAAAAALSQQLGVGAGSFCTNDLDCAPPLWCDLLFTGTCRKIAFVPPTPVGRAGAGPLSGGTPFTDGRRCELDRECPYGQLCAATGFCSFVQVYGGFCVRSSDCQVGFVCSPFRRRCELPAAAAG